MSTHAQQFASLRVNQILHEIPEVLERIEIPLLNEDQVSNLTRLKKGIAALRSRIDAIDPELLSLESIQNFGSYISNIHNQCTAFISNRDFGHINNANSYFDQVLNTTRIQLVLAPEVDKAASTAVTEAHERSLELSRRSEVAIADQKVRIEECHQSTSRGSARVQELENTIEIQKSRLDQAISNFQEQFSGHQSQRATEFATITNHHLQEFSSLQRDLSNKFENGLAEQTDQFGKHLSELKQRTAEHQAFLDKRRSEVDEMFGAIGQGIRAGHFAKSADAERDSANTFRWISLGLMTAMIATAGFTYYYSLTHTAIDWIVLLLRFGTTLIVAIPAVYAAQESSKHRDREKKLRKLHLELASIDAYLALLPTETQYRLKEALTAKFFGQTEEEAKIDDVSKHALFDIIKDVVNNLTKSK